MDLRLTKLVPKIPELIGRALMGDPSAIVLLSLMGISVAASAIKDNNSRVATENELKWIEKVSEEYIYNLTMSKSKSI